MFGFLGILTQNKIPDPKTLFVYLIHKALQKKILFTDGKFQTKNHFKIIM